MAQKSVFIRSLAWFGRKLIPVAILAVAASAISAMPDDSSDDVLKYVNATVAWHRNITSFNQIASSEETLFRDAVRQNSDQVLKLAFAYGRGEAGLVSQNPTSTPGSDSSKMQAAAVAAVQRIAQIQTELDRVNAQIKNAPTTAPVALTARRDKLVSELNLAKIRQDVLHDFVGFSSGNGSAGLVQKLDQLEHTIPATSDNAPAAQDSFRAESAGILGLISEMFTLSNRVKQLKELAAQTAALKKDCEERRAPLRTALQDAIRRSEELSHLHDSDDPKTLEAQRKELDALAARYKMLATAAVPLGEEGILLESLQATLQQWHAAVDHSYARVIRALLVRLGAIVGTILVLLLISTIWRRATFRYVTDIRRRRQFLMIRRLIVGAIITVVVIAGIVTELSSLATFAGLITAGIAVALQTVILSGVAHFFFIGRYGVRVGDRVTLSGITGDVIDIGIFRLYLMELGGDSRDLNPTGRVVVFSNSVLFQPTPFFKQIPGAEYTWHEMALTLAPDTNHELAEKQLMAAVESVVAEYRDTIDRQYAILKQSTHIPLPPPDPHGRLRFVDSGLEFVVRYPIEIRRAAEIDDRITRKLLETIEKEPSLRLVASGTPKIQTASATPHAA